ncbi:MAG: Gfo/Idh/MocA family oxidoreductase [bacterium]|nr:Gfo/Idh/MocA family oxidoreductase [bacterium]
MTVKLRAVMCGCGGMSNVWLNVIKTLPDVEMVGLVDINEAAARGRAEQFGLAGARVGTDLEKMLGEVKPDVVFAMTVPEAHHGVVLAALAHGCHVLGEKPLADSMAHAREMVTAAAAAGKTYAVIQNRRYDPRIRRVRRFVEGGALGTLTTLNCDFYLAPRFGGFRDRMRHVLLLDMAIHTFDAARYLSGADPAAVYCHEWNPAGSWYDHDASAVAVFEMTGGLVYTYRGSWCAEGLWTTWESDWRLVGTQGSLKWDGGDALAAQTLTGMEGRRAVYQDAAVPPAVADAKSADVKSGGHAGVIAEFLRCVRTCETPETAAADNIKSLAMVFGAIESAETGRKVEIKI